LKTRGLLFSLPVTKKYQKVLDTPPKMCGVFLIIIRKTPIDQEKKLFTAHLIKEALYAFF
jgi:hypothetical protein